MPPCDALYLVGWLWEIGPTAESGMGSGPITHGEIESWQRNTGVELDSWQARTLRSLSIDYLNESHSAASSDCPAPWNPAGAPVLSRESESLRTSLRALANL